MIYKIFVRSASCIIAVGLIWHVQFRQSAYVRVQKETPCCSCWCLFSREDVLQGLNTYYTYATGVDLERATRAQMKQDVAGEKVKCTSSVSSY